MQVLLMALAGCSKSEVHKHGPQEQAPGQGSATRAHGEHRHGQADGAAPHARADRQHKHGPGHADGPQAQGAHQHNHGNPADLEAYVARLEAPDRAQWQRPDEVVAKLALPAGAVACEIGAGPGYFTLRLSKAVGDKGVVYAVDVEPRLLGVLRERLEASGARNVVPVLGLMDDPLLPAGACELVLVVNTVHHFTDPVAYLKRIKHTLKSGGRLVNIDFHKRPSPMGPPMEMRIDREDFVSIADKAGLKPSAEHELLPHQYFIELVAK
jgi:SAM-dependent methyltransferase